MSVSYLSLVLQAWMAESQDRTATAAALADLTTALSQLGGATSFLALRMQTLEQKVDQLMSGTAQLDTELNTLHQQVAANGDVAQSAVALLNGFGARLQAVQAQLQAQGVQPGQLTALTDFTTQLQQQKDALAQAVAANTVADPATSGGASTTSGGATTDTSGAAPAASSGNSTSTAGTAQADQA